MRSPAIPWSPVPALLSLTLVACASGGHRGGAGGLLLGPQLDLGDATSTMASSETGIAVALGGGSSAPSESALPNAFVASMRQVGDRSELALAAGYQLAFPGGYVRATVALLERDTTGEVTRFGAGSPALEIGLAPTAAGPCVALTAGLDVRIGAPDHPYLGLMFGWCGAGR